MDTKITLQDEIIKDLGIEKLPKEKREEILIHLSENILKSTWIEVLSKIKPEDRNVFDKIQDTGTVEEMTVFLQEKIPNYDQIALEQSKLIIADLKKRVSIK